MLNVMSLVRTVGYTGGISCGQYLSTTERFDPSANEWEEVAPINQARSGAFGASMNGKVYIAGGQWRSDIISTCKVYNPVTNEWHLMASLMEPRKCASMVHYEGSLYVLGGLKQVYDGRRRSHSAALSVEMFHSEQNEWKKKTVIPTYCIETNEEEDKETNKFKACFVRLFKGVIDKLKPLITQSFPAGF
ncbi:influenza virus NS1A-binding protein-like isoform X2 [Orbicella faveolata]|uniref:influenza virus NS1A-binding protein-like isoform X2 n=1 Tax=Orbicella faveolata TaxID=48498 RepID=UPI0009E39F6F|nr:influenza virus NS1A-binding protein-like isoform X2 [Orbicella faveolata]